MGMYVHFSQMKEARKVFDLMDEKSIISWTTIMGGYMKVGHVTKAFNLFNQMQHQSTGIDFIVFLNLISGCVQVGDLLLASSVQAFVFKCGCDKEESIENLLITIHAGLVEDGLKYFICMQKDFGITLKIEHYTCLVDLLGRVGRLDLALGTIQGIPLEAQVQAWAPLLSACRIHGNVELGEIATVKLLELSPSSSGNYVLMANLYTSFGKWKEAHVEIGGRFHTFAAGNQSRVQLANIYKMLEDLNFTLQEGSYAGQAVTMNNDPSSYIEANMKIEFTASELTRADNLKSDLENNKNQFNDMVASEKSCDKSWHVWRK
ncbi:pentatricopeptide repeat-containing protein At5g39350-like [Arachis stenosperma]|uniref:pentatricopeptide repeat-containing protein At5g39350-like n=1 Tax=Arachis stenosperma TaxID=217475 RepID=UPI0025AB713A|nr:pentatricopeptide repeat-containing protein At5g39350-like [Arachis stenosperma]